MQLLRKRDREGFMVDTKSLQSDRIAEFETPCRSVDLNGKDTVVVATPDRSVGEQSLGCLLWHRILCD